MCIFFQLTLCSKVTHLIHLGLVALLMIIFPFSKLLHVPGVFFSPTRNQVDNPREVRYVPGVSKPVETGE